MVPLRQQGPALTDYSVASGQTSSSITLNAGDTITVAFGGTAVDVTVSEQIFQGNRAAFAVARPMRPPLTGMAGAFLSATRLETGAG